MPKKIDLDARRAEIAEAVWAIVVAEGIAAVSVRSVAARAGLAVGSLRHVFPTRDELVEFSAELMLSRSADRLRALERGDDPAAYALALCLELLPLDAQRRAELEVNLALIAEAPAVPRLAEMRDLTYREIGAVCRDCLALAAGTRTDEVPPRRARRLHALLDGLALHLLHDTVGADHTWAVDLVRAELTGTP